MKRRIITGIAKWRRNADRSRGRKLKTPETKIREEENMKMLREKRSNHENRFSEKRLLK